MSSNFPGGSPLAYLGLPEKNPPDIITTSRDPLTSDYKNVKIGDFWYNKTSRRFWMLVGLAAQNATWDPVAGATAGDINFLTGDTGGAVSGDSGGNVNLLGTAGQIAVTGNPATNTLTLSLAGGGTAIDSFIPDAGTNPVVPTAAGAVTMVGGNGVLTTGGLNTLTFDMQSPFTGDFTFTSVTSGDTETLTVSNSSNTASSQAQLNLSVAGSSAGDAYTTYTVSGVTNWSEGVDNSDSDTWKLSPATTLGTNDVFRALTTGIVSMPQTTSALYIGTTTPVNPSEISIEKSTSGGQVEIEVRNSSNTASSDCLVGIVVGGASAGDPYVTYNVAGVQSWTHGIDNSASDAFKISASNTLGMSDCVAITTAGVITQPSQPTFGYYNSVTRVGVTGDGTAYTLIFNTASFTQRGSGFDGTSTFTAPVDGIYNFHCNVLVTGLAAGHTSGEIRFIVGATTYFGDTYNVGAMRTASNICTIAGSKRIGMSAGNTLTVQVIVSGGAAGSISVDGTAQITYLDGTLEV